MRPTWLPVSRKPDDQIGSEFWVIEVPAKEVKDEVAFQLGLWKAKYEMVKEFDREWRIISATMHQRMPSSLNPLSEDDKKALEAQDSRVNRDSWQRWKTYLANMPDHQVLTLTKKDYETFFGDRDERERMYEI